LPRDPQRAGLQFDVIEAELRHVASPQPEARQEQDDRAITPARNHFASHTAIKGNSQRLAEGQKAVREV
jgi:hypothetical protein